MRELVLGVDIGNDTTTVGYVDIDENGKWVFKQTIISSSLKRRVPDAKKYINYGIPTSVACDRNGYICYGIEAEDNLDYKRNKNGEWETLGLPLKSCIKNSFNNGLPDDVIIGNFTVTEVLKGFVEYLAGLTKECLDEKFKAGSWKIKAIVFAYPNTEDTKGWEQYEEKIAGALRNSFGCEKVVAMREGELAGLLLGKVCPSYNDIITLDFGRGTCDFCRAHRLTEEKVGVKKPKSVDFGGNTIDQVMYEKNLITSLRRSSKTLRECKSYCFLGEGEPVENIPKFKNGQERKSLCNEINTLIRLSDDWKELKPELEKFAKDEKKENTAVFLMGGCSVIPFVQEEVKKIFGENIIFLSEWAKDNNIPDLTNGNFIAYAAASFFMDFPGGRKTIITPKKTLAIKLTNGGYDILVDEEVPQNGTVFYLTHGDYLRFNGERKENGEHLYAKSYKIADNIYQLELVKSLNGKKTIEKEEIEEYIKESKLYKKVICSSERIRQHKESDRYASKEKCYPHEYGVIIRYDNNNEVDWENVEIYLFNKVSSNDYIAYYDQTRMKGYTYLEFKQKYEDCLEECKRWEEEIKEYEEKILQESQNGINETQEEDTDGQTQDPQPPTENPTTNGNDNGGTEEKEKIGYWQSLFKKPLGIVFLIAAVAGVVALLIGVVCNVLESTLSPIFIIVGAVALATAVVVAIIHLYFSNKPQNYTLER